MAGHIIGNQNVCLLSTHSVTLKISVCRNVTHFENVCVVLTIEAARPRDPEVNCAGLAII